MAIKYRDIISGIYQAQFVCFRAISWAKLFQKHESAVEWRQFSPAVAFSISTHEKERERAQGARGAKRATMSVNYSLQ